VSPAIAIFGDAETKTVQGSGNSATANVDQSNSVDQSQSSYQKQNLDQSGGSCCGGQSQTGEQKTFFGDQTVDKQKNEADVDQYQGNGNLNISPAISIFGGKEQSCYSKCEKSWHPFGGDAKTTTIQGSGNEATANVDQSNSVDQSQSAYQKQYLTQEGGECCKPSSHGCEPKNPCAPKKYGEQPKGSYEKDRVPCCESESQSGEQKAFFGDQTVEKQKNEADVTQKQGNWNGSFAPALGFIGDAETKTVQGSGNEATAHVGQSNSAEQSQAATQYQSLIDACKGLVYR
jgi:hypothetical protein